MSEEYNAEHNLRIPTYFNHLMLQGEVQALTGRSDFDPKKLQVDLTINGCSVNVGDFNKILEDWGLRIESQIKDKVNYLSKEKSVNDNAVALLKEKLGGAYDILQSIEDNSWKLEE